MSKNQHTIILFLTGIYSISGVFCSWVTCSENGVAYLFEEQKANWHEAARRCEFAGGSLAIVWSNFDENCIIRNLKQSVGAYSIGGTKSSSGLWTWMDGTLITQPTYWATDEPNNSGGNENCLQFRLYDGIYFWNDIPCSVTGGYVCQRTSYITGSMTSVTKEQSTTPAMETIVTTHVPITPYCEDMPNVDCVPIIENTKDIVDSALQGNLSKTELKLTIDRALLNLQTLSTDNEQTPEDLDISVDLLYKIVDISQTSNVSLPKSMIVTTMDNILAENHTAAWKNTSTKQVGARINKIFKTVDKIGLHLLETVNENETITFNSTKNIVITVAKIPADQPILFPENNSISMSSLVFAVQACGFNQSIPYLAVKYITLAKNLKGNKRMTENSGNDISSDIMSLTLNDPLFRETLDPSIHIKFLKELIGVKANNVMSECVFWDFQLNNGSGTWSTKGCKLLSTDDLYLHCECNHLTNFAVLMRPYSRIQDEEVALNWISTIGCSISVFLSLLTAIIYIFYWKSITVNVNRIINKITVSLCLSLSIAYTLFLVGVDKIQNEVGCAVITALLHYLFLLIFFLMLALGWHYFSSISLVKLSLSKATTLQSHANVSGKVTWGVVTAIPVCITAVTFGIVYSSGKDYHSPISCWLSFDSGALYGFIGPVAGIILVNIIIVFSLIVTLYSTTISSQGKLKKRTLAGIKSICTLLPVLGVTWLFGLLSINEDVVIFQYIFSLLNSFQGLFIFNSKCLLNKKIRKLLSKHVHIKGSENWRSRFYTLLSSNTVSLNTKEFSSVSKIPTDGEELFSKQKEGDPIQGISFTMRESVNTVL